VILHLEGVLAVIGRPGEDEGQGLGFRLSVPQLALHRGDLVAVQGPSGSGKSAVLEVAALLRRPEQVTSFTLVGADLRSAALTADSDLLAGIRRGRLTYVPQSGGVLPFLTARDNALAGLRAEGHRIDAEIAARLEAGAHALGIGGALGKRRDALSGGERRRVGLLRALVSRPPLAILDEPTSALDAAAADAALAALVTLANTAGTAVLTATHDVARFAAAGFRPMQVVETAAGRRSLLSAA